MQKSLVSVIRLNRSTVLILKNLSTWLQFETRKISENAGYNQNRKLEHRLRYSKNVVVVINLLNKSPIAVAVQLIVRLEIRKLRKIQKLNRRRIFGNDSKNLWTLKPIWSDNK